MATVSNKEFDADVLLAIKYIEEASKKVPNLFAFPKTIVSFLMGKTKSPFYKSVYSKHPDICGVYTRTDETAVEESLKRLNKAGMVERKVTNTGRILYKIVPPKKKPVLPQDDDSTFYESAKPEEKRILDEFRKLIKELLPGLKLQDNKSTYGFESDIELIGKNGELYHPKLCWVSRDRNTRKLKLHYKKKADGSESDPIDLTTERKRTEAWRVLRVAYSKSGGEVKDIVSRIIAGDKFDEYQSKNVVNIELMPHQKAGVLLAKQYNRFAYFYDTGTGKTVMALDIMMNKQLEKKARFLVVAPKVLIKSAWLDDSKYFPKMKLLPLSTNMTVEDYARLYDQWRVADGGERFFTDEDGYLIENKKDLGKLKNDIFNELLEKANHFIINIEAIKKPSKGNELFNKLKVNGLMIDESVVIKNYASEASKRMRVFAKNKKTRFVYLLSGKPAPNSTIDYYSQMVIVDPKTFNLKFGTFVSKYFQEVSFGRYIEKVGKRNELAKMIGNRSITIKKEDCIKLPEAFHQKRYVDIDDDLTAFYNDVLHRYIAEIITMDGERLKVNRISRLGLLMKLREIASGLYLDSSGEPYRLSKHKLSAIKDLIEEIGYDDSGSRNKILIWCSFKFEIQELERQLSKEGYKVVTAYSESGRMLDENVASFKLRDADIMIAHPQTLKYGVTLTRCHYAIFSSMSYSYDDYYQAHDRIYRNGQDKVCFFYHLITEDTIDEIIYKCVMEKSNKSKFFERLVRSAQRRGTSRDDVNRALSADDETKKDATNDKDLKN